MTDREALRQRLCIPSNRLEAINGFLLDQGAQVVNDLLDVVAKYGTPEEINAQAAKARELPNLLARLAEQGSPYLEQVE